MSEFSTHIKQLKNGDIAAFEYLYNTWSTKLYNFVLRVSYGDKFHAEDIVQSVFIKIWEIREELDPEKNFESLVYTIARNMVVNMHQRKMHESLYEENIKKQYEDELVFDSDSIEGELDVKILENVIDRFIEELPSERRKIFIMSRKHYMTNKQIAEELDISVNTVEAQMTKAIAYLRNKLSKITR